MSNEHTPGAKRKRTIQHELAPSPTRVKNFAEFFKNYMSVSAVLAAALPIPVASFQLIPIHKAQVGIAATYTSLYCFLMLGFIFYSRHRLARWMFPERFLKVRSASRNKAVAIWMAILPVMLIGFSSFCQYAYHTMLDASFSSHYDGIKLVDPLNTRELHEIPSGNLLLLLYIGIFVFAEAAFILMALKEYLQDLIMLTDIDLIHGVRLDVDPLPPVDLGGRHPVPDADRGGPNPAT